MKRFFSILLAACFLLAPLQLEAKSHDHKLMDGLLRIGSQMLQAEQNKLEKDLAGVSPEAAAAAASAAEQDAGGDAPPAKRTWKDRGKDMLGAFLTAQNNKDAGTPPGNLFAFSLKEGLDTLLNEYKKQYMEEGRAYARELGDTLIARIYADPKISGTITSIQILCWAVIIYLTLVSIFVVLALLRMERRNKRMMELLAEHIKKNR